MSRMKADAREEVEREREKREKRKERVDSERRNEGGRAI